MNLFTIAWKSIKQRWLSSALTMLNVALGVMLIVGVLTISGVVSRAFNQSAIPYDLIIGPAKGTSALQLVLSAVYRVEPAASTLPYSYLEDLAKDPRVAKDKETGEPILVPLAFGDDTPEGGFPIVATTPQYFELGVAPNRPFRVRGKRPNGPFDAVIGSEVAEKKQLGHRLNVPTSSRGG